MQQAQRCIRCYQAFLAGHSARHKAHLPCQPQVSGSRRMACPRSPNSISCSGRHGSMRQPCDRKQRTTAQVVAHNNCTACGHRTTSLTNLPGRHFYHTSVAAVLGMRAGQQRQPHLSDQQDLIWLSHHSVKGDDVLVPAGPAKWVQGGLTLAGLGQPPLCPASQMLSAPGRVQHGVSATHNCLPMSCRVWQAALTCFTSASSSADLHVWRKLSSFISSLGREMPLNCLTATSLRRLGLTHTPRNTVP